MYKKLLAANWKMNLSKTSSIELAKKISEFEYDSSALELTLFPSFVHIDSINNQIKNSDIILGAQNCCHENGSFTGEISPVMLKELNCKYVIIGHSERRHSFFETNEMIQKKISFCQSFGIHPILCLGEPLEIYKKQETLKFILTQLRNSLPEEFDFSNITLAYEPVWAIGSGLVPTANEIAIVASELKKFTSQKCRIIYGGSVNRKNIEIFCNVNNLDGFLVGNASLDQEEFHSLLKIYQQYLIVNNPTNK